MSIDAALEHARLTPLAKDVLRAVMSEPMTDTVTRMSTRFNVTRRSIFRALAELESAGLVAIESTPGRSGSTTVKIIGDPLAKLKRLCHHLGREDEPAPGAEYTPVRDVDAVKRDRARYCHATGTGPKWARELGAAMARGEV